MSAMTEMPAKTPRPIGSTCSFLPGRPVDDGAVSLALAGVVGVVCDCSAVAEPEPMTWSGPSVGPLLGGKSVPAGTPVAAAALADELSLAVVVVAELESVESDALSVLVVDDESVEEAESVVVVLDEEDESVLELDEPESVVVDVVWLPAPVSSDEDADEDDEEPLSGVNVCVHWLSSWTRFWPLTTIGVSVMVQSSVIVPPATGVTVCVVTSGGPANGASLPPAFCGALRMSARSSVGTATARATARAR